MANASDGSRASCGSPSKRRINIVVYDLAERDAGRPQGLVERLPGLPAGEDVGAVWTPGNEEPLIGDQFLQREVASVLVVVAQVGWLRRLTVGLHRTSP